MELQGPVIVLDCQTTGANPKKGHLLEIAWCQLETLGVTSHLVRLPAGASFPRAITRLTGIRPKDLDQAIAPSNVWASLLQAADPAPIPTLIHFAQFERPFLEQLHREHGQGSFPLDIICTHQIAKRLVPDLPRRSLRALAGYFGFLKPELKRAASHVEATLHIWEGLSALLDEQRVLSFDDLKRWLAESPTPPRPTRRRYPMSRKKRLRLAEIPGVYHFRNRRGDLLYVGKATSLRRRVNSYFQKQRRIPERTLELLTQTTDVEVAPTESALEAALLEAETIRQLAPPYNKALNRDRPVWFATLDLRGTRTAPDEAHRVGPVRSRDALTAVAALVDWLSGATEKHPAKVLAIPGSRAPDTNVFAQGVALFLERHPVSGVSALLRLGTRLWRDRKLDAEPQERDGEVEWDPPKVAVALEETVLRAAHLIRRAHWLQELCSCNLLWHPRGDAGSLRVLVVREGKVIDRFLDGARPLEPPPNVPLGMRLAWLDSATHDRIRVLGTELKRLAIRDSELTLQLGRGCLARRSLARRIWWV